MGVKARVIESAEPLHPPRGERAAPAVRGMSACGSEAAERELPLELLDDIARRGGWREWARVWHKVCKRFSLRWLRDGMPDAVLVPDEAPTINAAISIGRGIVIVRPGLYRESVRVTNDVVLLGLGVPGSAKVQPPGWEPAIVWGGFKAGKVSASGGSGQQLDLRAVSGGSRAEVHGLGFAQRNQLAQTAVYITVGEPLLAHCDIAGTVHVAGRASTPVVARCRVHSSRSCGVRIVDHASSVLRDCYVFDNQLAAVCVSSNAHCLSYGGSQWAGNGYDGVQASAEAAGESDSEEAYELGPAG